MRFQPDSRLSLEWLYKLDELRAYSVDTKQGRERLDLFTKHLPGMLEAAGLELPPKPRVLCLMAGSCVEGIAYGQLLQAQVTCLDLQRQMLAKGKREARRRKLKLATATGDAKEVARVTKGQFDLVTIHGSPLPHLNIFEFDQIVDGVKKVLGGHGTFLLEQSDLVFRILSQYRDVIVANLKPVVLNVHKGFNPSQGYFERLYYSRSKHELFRYYLWSPWIVEYVLKKNGFSNVRVKPYADPYAMAQTYLFTSQK